MAKAFSHSRIGTFETCPLQYKYSYIDDVEVESEDTVEKFMGSRVHEALEKLYKDLQFEKHLTLKELLGFFNKIWKENWNDTIKIVKKEYKQENYRKIGERCLTDYYNRYAPFNNGKVIGLETKNYVNLDENYKFHVRIDRLMDMSDGVYEIHDYKTSNSLPKQEDLDSDRQLAIYSLWVKENFKDFKKVKLIWHFVVFDKEMESSRTAGQLEDLRKDVLKQIKKIESTEKFEPNQSALCNWCAYQNICPLWAHELKLEEKPVNEYLKDPGVKLVNEYVKIKNDLKIITEEAEEKLEKLKEAIVHFAKKEGIEVVVGSDNKIRIKEEESISFPPKNSKEREELVKMLEDMKKLEEVMDLDTFALKRIVKDKEWNEKELKKLEKYETIEKGQRLSLSKKR